MQGYIQHKVTQKKKGILAGPFYIIHHVPLSFTSRDFQFFSHSLQKALMKKSYKEDQVKTFMEDFLNSKTVEFYF